MKTEDSTSIKTIRVTSVGTIFDLSKILAPIDDCTDVYIDSAKYHEAEQEFIRSLLISSC